MTKKDVLALFRGVRVDAGLAHRVYREHGRSTFEDLQRDPYTTLFPVQGSTIDHADKIARHFRKPVADLVLGHALWMVLRRPTPLNTLQIKIQSTLGIPRDTMASIMQTLLDESKIFCVHKYVLHPREYAMLERVADDALERCDGMDFHDPMEDAFGRIECTSEQRMALNMVAYHKLSVITGGPGCGKSWIVRHMVHNFPNARVTAPTGRAARNAEGKTVHYFKTIQETQKNELSGIELIIIDEASMLSAYLFDAVLQMTSPNAHVVLVGDQNQLPPIQTGHVLRDILGSGKVPSVQLTQNQRSIAPIHNFCTNILRNVIADIPDCVQFIECHTVDDMLNALPRVYPNIVLTPHNATRVQMNRVLQLYTTGMRLLEPIDVTIKDAYGCLQQGRQGTVHVSPRHVVISDGLSTEQTTYAVASRTVQLMGIPAESETVIRKHDKVIVTKNTATLCNGDMGTYMGNSMIETADDTYRVEPISETDPGFALGYCITVHKAQGSEFNTVIIPITNVSAWTKTLLYTAATRAKEKIIFLGTRHDLQCILRHHAERQPPPFLESMLQQS